MDDVLYAIYEDVIKQYTQKGTLLEVGCGTAYLSRTLSTQGYTVTAFDQSETMLTVASYLAGALDQPISLYKHDINHPFSGTFDSIIMPIDVINHLPTIDAIKHAFNHITHALNPRGVFIFDILDEAYYTVLKDHHEILLLKDGELDWKASAVSEHTIEHTLHLNGETATHLETFYPHQAVLDLLTGFIKVHEIKLDHRTIYVLKKKEE